MRFKPFIIVVCILIFNLFSSYSSNADQGNDTYKAVSCSDVPNELNGIVVDINNKPVNGAVVNAYSTILDHKTQPKKYETISGSDGRFHITVPVINGEIMVQKNKTEQEIANIKNTFYYSYYQIYATTPTTFGIALPLTEKTDNLASVKIPLCPTVNQRIQILMENKPVAYLKTCLKSISYYDALTHNYVTSDSRLLNRMNPDCVTDANGVITYKNLPKGYFGHLELKDDRYIEFITNFDITGDSSPLKFKVFKAGKIIGKLILPKNYIPGKPITCDARNIDISSSKYVFVDKTGDFVIPHLKTGLYYVSVNLPLELRSEWICKPQRVEVTAEKPAKVILTLEHGNLITGKVTFKGTNKPAPNMEITCYSQSRYTTVTTDANGVYKTCLPEGNFNVHLYDYVNNQLFEEKSISIKKGEKLTLNYEVNPPIPMVPITGIVVDDNGKPAVGTEILVLYLNHQHTPGVTITSDSTGHFTIEPQRTASRVVLFAHLNQNSTVQPVIVERGTTDVRLILHPNALATISGYIYDGNKRPLANKNIELWQDMREAHSKAGSITSDAKGHYTFPVVYPGIKYYTYASMNYGYSYKSSESKVISPGNNIICDITILPTNSFVAGRVLNVHKKPVQYAVISCANSDLYQCIITDKNGRFRIEHVPNGILDMTVAVEGINWGKTAIGGKNDNIIYVDDTPAAEREKKLLKFQKMVKETKAEDIRKATAVNNTPTYDELMKKAKVDAKARGVNLLIIFHASWCGPCHVLMEYLRRPNVKEIINRRFELVIFDIWENDKTKILENEGAAAKIAQFDGTRYIPYTVVADVNDKVLAKGYGKNGVQFGMPSEPDDINIFMGMLQQNSKMTTDEAAVLKKELNNSKF